MHVATIGFDIAKHVFQVHGADAAGRPVLQQRLRRGQVLAFFGSLDRCVVGIEACATAHHWARKLQAPIRGTHPGPPPKGGNRRPET